MSYLMKKLIFLSVMLFSQPGWCTDAIGGMVEKQPLNIAAVNMFLIFS